MADKFEMTFNDETVEGSVTAMTLCDYETFFNGDMNAALLNGDGNFVRLTDLLRAAWCCIRTVNPKVASFQRWVETINTWDAGRVRAAITSAIRDSAFHGC